MTKTKPQPKKIRKPTTSDTRPGDRLSRNPALWKPITIEPTDAEKMVILRMIERIPRSARTVLEEALLKKIARKRKTELELNGSERYAITEYIAKIPVRQRSQSMTSLREKVL